MDQSDFTAQIRESSAVLGTPELMTLTVDTVVFPML